MKRTIILGLIVGMSHWALGDSVLDFQMNDAQGTGVASLQNDAGGGGFSYGDNNMYTDGMVRWFIRILDRRRITMVMWPLLGL